MPQGAPEFGDIKDMGLAFLRSLERTSLPAGPVVNTKLLGTHEMIARVTLD